MYSPPSPTTSGENNLELSSPSRVIPVRISSTNCFVFLGEDHSHTHTEGLVGSRYPFTFLSINVGSSSRIKDTPSEGPVISSSGGKRSFNFSTSRSHDEEDAGLGQGADYSEPAKIRRRLSWSYGINRIFIDQNSSFCSNSYSSSNSIQVGEGLPKKDQFCMQERWIIMNEVCGQF